MAPFPTETAEGRGVRRGLRGTAILDSILQGRILRNTVSVQSSVSVTAGFPFSDSFRQTACVW